jgi:hypothetical protein
MGFSDGQRARVRGAHQINAGGRPPSPAASSSTGVGPPAESLVRKGFDQIFCSPLRDAWQVTIVAIEQYL